MKKTMKNALALALALCLALAAIPASALPRFDVKAEVTPNWTVPDGYNVHDYTKCVEFLEQTDEDGVKNGEKANWWAGEHPYDPSNPATWSGSFFRWREVNGELRLEVVSFSNEGKHSEQSTFEGASNRFPLNCAPLDGWYDLVGDFDFSDCTELVYIGVCPENTLEQFDVSGCSALNRLECSGNAITGLNISGCTALRWLECRSNNLTELDVTQSPGLRILHCGGNNLTELDLTQNPELGLLHCDGNNLTELDVSGCIALEELECNSNNLTELDVSGCTALQYLSCYSNNLTELDLSSNPLIDFDHIRAEGSGFIGYRYNSGILAHPANGAVFEGFYDESGALISEGEWNDWYGAYICMFEGTPTRTVIARFSGGALPGDIDGNGSVSVADAISTLRLSMGIADGSGLNTDAADMDGNGSVTLADAIIILRIAMGLA